MYKQERTIKKRIKEATWIPRMVASQLAGMANSALHSGREQTRILPMPSLEPSRLYPRPQFVRGMDTYMDLCGEWELATEDNIKEGFPLKIKVPYPPQSVLSGIEHPEEIGDGFWYHRTFVIKKDFKKDRIILHFGAVDQVAEVYLNGQLVGKHEGGYLPFEFDVTDIVNIETEELTQVPSNDILVKVTDSLDTRYPYGKQTKKRGGMWYTPVSGIWQSVWLESVPARRIDRIRVSGDLAGVTLDIDGTVDEYDISVTTPDGILTRTLRAGSNRIDIINPMHWSPESPYLYQFELSTEEDRVLSYFALRTISIKDIQGHARLCLNDKPYFFHGVLDQGYFSDGIYTPVSDQYYEKDILAMKELGFNTLRKHIKIEPAQFYYDCDRLGMIVFQDMVNNGSYSFVRDTAMPTFFGWYKDDTRFDVDKETKDFFIQHSKDIIEYLHSFASVCYYTIFNEGWGQFEADRVYTLLKELDPTRIYDATSGWFLQTKSDVDSIHCYFHELWVKDWTRPAIISEFGGFSLQIKDHSYNLTNNYGYGASRNESELTSQILSLYRQDILPAIRKGVCASIYTQLADVEDETNGLYTTDRAVCKVEKSRMRRLAKELFTEFEKNCCNAL